MAHQMLIGADRVNVHRFLRLPVLGLAFLEIQMVLPVFSFPARPCAIMFKVEQCRLSRS